MKNLIETKFKEAYKAKDKQRVATYRNIKSEITNKEKNGVLSDNDIIYIIEKYIKARLETIEYHKKNNNQEGILEEQFEIDCLKEFVPEKMNEDEIKEIILSLNCTNIGAVMKEISIHEKSSMIDKKIVSKICKDIFS